MTYTDPVDKYSYTASAELVPKKHRARVRLFFFGHLGL
jgi:hypothetical protein